MDDSATFFASHKVFGASSLGVFRHFQRVINLDSKIAHGALNFGVAKKKLLSTQVFGASVDE